MDVITLLPEHQDKNPLKGVADVVFTSKKIFFVTAEEISKSGTLLVGGAIGVALAQAVVDVRMKLKERRLDADDLETLVENGVALSILTKHVACKVIEMKKDLFDRFSINSTRTWALFEGPFELGNDVIDGRVSIELMYSREKTRRKIENVSPIKVTEIAKKFPLEELLEYLSV